MTALETLASIKLKRANDNLVATEKQLTMSAEMAKRRLETCLPITKISKRDRKFQNLLVTCILGM